MQLIQFIKYSAAALLACLSAASAAEGLKAYVGVGGETPVGVYSSSSQGFKVFGGAKINEFPISKAGAIQLAVQGEYVNFGKTTYSFYSVTSDSVGVDGVGTWIIPKKWAGWADEKLSVVAKLGGAYVTENWSYGTTVNSIGLTRGIGAEYRFIPDLGVNVMHEQYPGYSLISVSGVFHF